MTGTITVDDLKWARFSDSWVLIGECMLLGITSLKDYDEFDYCRYIGGNTLAHWAWVTEKYKNIGMTKEDAWWGSWDFVWEYLGTVINYYGGTYNVQN